MAPRDTALKTTAGGSIPGHCNLKLQHPESQQQPLLTGLPQAIECRRDEVALGLLLGNLIAAAVYGTRGELRN